MTLTYPLNLLDDFPGWSTEFEPAYRQEFSRAASGATTGKDLGSPLWRGTWVSKKLSANMLDHWRARLEALEGVLKTFRAYPMSRCRPMLHPGSASLPAGTLQMIHSDRKRVIVAGLTDISLSVGDMLQVGTTDLHRVMEAASGNPTALFEVRPHMWPGVEEGAAVKILRPSCIMAVVPGSVAISADLTTGRGTVTFQGFEVR